MSPFWSAMDINTLLCDALEQTTGYVMIDCLWNRYTAMRMELGSVAQSIFR